jgi:hypothetical protein
MPGELKPRFDELRFSVVKAALQDVSFFANPQHPVRGLVNELGTLAASARAMSLDTLQRIEDLVSRIQEQFQVAAEAVRHPKVDPLEHVDIERFLTDQIDKNRQRRKAVIDKVKRIVEEELQLRSSGHNVPAPALRLFRSGWAPMMAAHLLRTGMNSEPWHEGLGLLKEMLSALDHTLPSPRGGSAALIARIDEKLAAVGMAPTRRKELLDGFLPALSQAELKRRPSSLLTTPNRPDGTDAEAVDTAAPVEAKPVSAPAISRESLLDALVVAGSWFRIVDPVTSQNRWLRAVTHYPGRGNVAFTEFNGRNSVFLKTEQFIDGLFNNRVEPLELMPVARDLLERFIAQGPAATA